MQKKRHHEAVASSQIWSQTRYEVQIFNHFFKLKAKYRNLAFKKTSRILIETFQNNFIFGFLILNFLLNLPVKRRAGPE
jgi:hypothetical protein